MKFEFIRSESGHNGFLTVGPWTLCVKTYRMIYGAVLLFSVLVNAWFLSRQIDWLLALSAIPFLSCAIWEFIVYDYHHEDDRS